MAKRRRYKKRSPIWSWVSFVVFGAIIALLGYAVVTKKSPAAVLKSLWSSDLPPDDLRGWNKSDLISKVETLEYQLDSLDRQLQSCLLDDGYTKAKITTSSPTLNLRSEASLESEIILRIPTQSTVSILYYDERRLFLDGAMGQWCRVRYADQEGWVWGNYIEEAQ